VSARLPRVPRDIRPAIIEAMRRLRDCVPSTTREQRHADQYAFLRGLSESTTGTAALSEQGRLWLAAAEAFSAGRKRTAA
jgi:hypothetical protein